MVTALKFARLFLAWAALKAVIASLIVLYVTVWLVLANVLIAAAEIEIVTLETDALASGFMAVNDGKGCEDVILGTTAAPTAFTVKSITGSWAGTTKGTGMEDGCKMNFLNPFSKYFEIEHRDQNLPLPLPPHDPSIDCALPGRVAASGNGAERGRECTDMLCPAALGFGDGRNVGVGCLGLVAGPAEDLQVCGVVCSDESQVRTSMQFF
jgi:hypothetical protein